jgi:hypothetical protein
MLPFNRFVNNFCIAPRLLHPYANDENIPTEDDVAYDCAANGNVTRWTFFPVRREECVFHPS